MPSSIRKRNLKYYNLTKEEAEKIVSWCRHTKNETKKRQIARLCFEVNQGIFEILYSNLCDGQSWEQLRIANRVFVSKPDFYSYRKMVLAEIKKQGVFCNGY